MMLLTQQEVDELKRRRGALQVALVRARTMLDRNANLKHVRAALLAAIVEDERHEGGKFGAAVRLLQAALRSGPVPALDLVEQARLAGISEKTLDRAKHRLRVASDLVHDGDRHGWVWRLPGAA